jgi:hypothetical protein
MGTRTVAQNHKCRRAPAICLFSAALATLLSGCALFTDALPPDVLPGLVQTIIPGSSESIPARRAEFNYFNLNKVAKVDVYYEIEGGKSVNIYVVTEEQAKQADDAHSRPNSYILYREGIAGNGSIEVTLGIGSYVFYIENPSGRPVQVYAKGTAYARSP